MKKLVLLFGLISCKANRIPDDICPDGIMYEKVLDVKFHDGSWYMLTHDRKYLSVKRISHEVGWRVRTWCGE